MNLKSWVKTGKRMQDAEQKTFSKIAYEDLNNNKLFTSWCLKDTSNKTRIETNTPAARHRDAKGNEPAKDFINSLLTIYAGKDIEDYRALLKEAHTRQIKGQAQRIKDKRQSWSYKGFIFYLYWQAVCFVAWVYQKDR